MSFFYASPVHGEMHLHDLESAVKDRVGFLQALVTGNELQYSEFLLEGTAQDNAGHFALCIVAHLASNTHLSQLVRTGEIKLFERRLSYLNPSTLRLFARKMLRYIKRHQLVERYSEALYVMCTKMSLGHVAEHICSSNHTEDCTRHTITVHFNLCLPLVAIREVELKAGQATVRCGLWMKYLVTLYKMHLNSWNKVREHLEVFREDDRIMSIVSQYITYDKGSERSIISSDAESPGLLSSNVDGQSDYFPPCMKNLHNAVRRNHRLSHDQRFYYTCFLKEIGMPVGEAIEFWRSEYSRSSGTSVCGHSWAADGAKYVRSIRHTYGLEGSRTSYSCAGCHKIQAFAGARAEGGCPFKTFSDESIKSVLHPDFSNSSQHMAKVHACRATGHFTKACNFYLETMFHNTTSSSEGSVPKKLLFLSPVKFYKEAVQRTHCNEII